MTIESKVTSLELSKKLKDLDVEQNGLLTWAESPHLLQQQEDGTVKCIETITKIRDTYYKLKDEIDSWAAFTSDELIEMLPAYINDWDLVIKKCPTEYEIQYCCLRYEKRLCIEWDKSFTNCLAKMLIYLIENDLFNLTKEATNETT